MIVFGMGILFGIGIGFVLGELHNLATTTNQSKYKFPDKIDFEDTNPIDDADWWKKGYRNNEE